MAPLMAEPHFQYIYGPVYSWRLGMSLGIDPLNKEQKYCSFNCTYCQLGRLGDLVQERRIFVPVEAIIEEIKALPKDCSVDYFTFSGNGEPTLAANLGEMIRAVKALHAGKVAVITNSATITLPDVRKDLRSADFILFKIDAPNQEIFESLNQPSKGLTLSAIIEGIREFKKTFEGKLALQMMFVEKNKACAKEMADIARAIAPDEVQLNTPLRPSPEKPLTALDMAKIKEHFFGMNILSVFEEEKKDYRPFNDALTAKRHGRYKE